MFRRILFVSLSVLIAALVAGGAFLFWSAKRAEPAYAGEVPVKGLSAAVSVRYGPHAVPTIEARNLTDLLFAQGFLVASERLWQMDLMRRLASGRLAEVLGEKALLADRFFRTLGLGNAARETFQALEETHRMQLQAYADGVNAFVAQTTGRVPLEYMIAGFEPTPWTPVDSLAIGEYMGWMLSFNAREELVYLRLAARLGPRRVLELFPTDEGIPAPGYARDLPDYQARIAPALDALFALPADYGLPVPGPASNAWAINGERTARGQALLANDIQLAPTAPGTWYELELHSPELHATGVTLPGLPFVTVGHNAHLAWGFTASIADTQDLFVERVTDDGTRVERPGGRPETIESRTETILVKGRDVPEQLRIRTTSNGVIVNAILGMATATPVDLPSLSTPYLLALRRNIEVPDRSVVAFYRLNLARTLEEARSAILDMRHVSMNLMLAHRDGGIAWQLGGLLPERGRGLGTFPAPGWEPGYGWTGYVDPDRNPGLTNPPGFALVTANHRTLPLDHPVQVSRSWMAPYRARRIEEMLGARIPLTAEDLARMQLDRVSLQARRFKQALGRVAPQIRVIDPEARRIADEYLMTWDGNFQGDSRAAALFVLLQKALFESLFADELGEDLPALMSIATVHYNALEEMLFSGEESSFWDDLGTAQREQPAHIWARALRQAKSELDQRMPELGSQRLDRLRRVSFPHAFDRIPFLGAYFGVGPLPTGGDTHTVNLMKASPLEPEEGRVIPSVRLIYTPADWDESRIVLPLGQSGHRFSAYRTDQLADWLEGRNHKMQWGGPAPGTEIGTMVLGR